MDPIWLLFIGIAIVVTSILVLRLHAFLALILAALIVGGLTPSAAIEEYGLSRKMTPEAALKMAQSSVGERVARGFGNTCASIGILIAMAAIIGKCLLDSGAADRIVRSFLKLVGEPRAPVAFIGSGFLLGIPVFFDTVFYLLMPLGKALASRTGRNYGLYVMTIIAGTSMTHSLVPPTPGPLFVASELKVDLGLMILGGMGVGLTTAFFGYLYAVWSNRRWPVPLRESAEISLAELEQLARRDERELPPLWLALLPILLPVVLIGGNAVLTSWFAQAGAETIAPWQATVRALFSRLGDKNIALVIAAGVALAMLVWHTRTNREKMAAAMQSALAGGGLIILITAAGGAFGAILQQTGIGERIEQLSATYQIAVLPLAFFVTALVRTAQGSATVAMITAVGMLANLAAPEQLGFHPLYLALAIGFGSKPFAWMNDSGFWIICKMSGMTETETLRNFSVMITLMGLIGLLLTMLLARVLPLV